MKKKSNGMKPETIAAIATLIAVINILLIVINIVIL